VDREVLSQEWIALCSGHGDDDVFGQPPAKLLGDFVTVGLGAFGVIRAQVDVDESPLEAVGDLGAEAVDMIVVAVDADDASDVAISSIVDLGSGLTEACGLFPFCCLLQSLLVFCTVLWVERTPLDFGGIQDDNDLHVERPRHLCG
jgi:hypothetical protein